MFEDEEKKRILAAIDAKIAGQGIVAAEHPEDVGSAKVIDLTQMLMASLEKQGKAVDKPMRTAPGKPSEVVTPLRSPEAKSKRAPKPAAKTIVSARTPRTRARK